jgi:hypothetical protein
MLRNTLTPVEGSIVSHTIDREDSIAVGEDNMEVAMFSDDLRLAHRGLRRHAPMRVFITLPGTYSLLNEGIHSYSTPIFVRFRQGHHDPGRLDKPGRHTHQQSHFGMGHGHWLNRAYTHPFLFYDAEFLSLTCPISTLSRHTRSPKKTLLQPTVV